MTQIHNATDLDLDDELSDHGDLNVPDELPLPSHLSAEVDRGRIEKAVREILAAKELRLYCNRPRRGSPACTRRAAPGCTRTPPVT